MSCKIIVLLLQKGGTAVFCDNLKQLREQSGIKQAALARENNPSASLSELAEMMEPPITKPAMNNRMKRLLQLAEEVKP